MTCICPAVPVAVPKKVVPVVPVVAKPVVVKVAKPVVVKPQVVKPVVVTPQVCLLPLFALVLLHLDSPAISSGCARGRGSSGASSLRKRGPSLAQLEAAACAPASGHYSI